MPYRQTLPHARSRHSDDRAGTASDYVLYDYVAGCAHLLRNPPVNCAAAHFSVDFVHFATQIRQELAAAYLGTKRNESLDLRSCVNVHVCKKTAAATITQQVVTNSINYIYSLLQQEAIGSSHSALRSRHVVLWHISIAHATVFVYLKDRMRAPKCEGKEFKSANGRGA